MILLAGAALLLQQAAVTGTSSPPGGDTTGYWQQRVSYAIVAHLDEGLLGVTARGSMRYVNNSPDTLREMYFHQYLNAYKPGSKWSAADTKENRQRFQGLGEPHYGYERFSRAPLVDGIPTLVDYPGAPDSTVAHLRLPRPLAPGDSLTIDFAWEGRPSAILRRQGRRGRSYDFAQWYPKVAVYDRAGWHPNALRPAGELYGEFATYDVTIVAHADQVLAATGVVVEGDPGWARVSRTGVPWTPRRVYDVPAGPVIMSPSGERAVRFYAENIHHFAWTASPEYVHEGGIYLRRDTSPRRFRTFDTVAVNVLYRPGDDTTWGGGRAVTRTVAALEWLEKLYGPYAYPQITNVHRLDGGATEFPMMVMNSSPSRGLILHELGHVYTYGALANNEWRSAWMDEAPAEYESRWAQLLTPQDTARPGRYAPRRIPPGYRGRGVGMSRTDSADFEMLQLELMGRSEPLGQPADDFRELGIYGKMTYDRGSIMLGHLRELMGDSVFVAFWHDYYDRWAFRHVDERAMRASAARAYGKDLGWFFDQWVYGTGLLNYGVGRATTTESNGGFVTRVRVVRRGDLRHPMPVGVRTADGWTIVRAREDQDDQYVEVATRTRPDSVALDPFHVTWDWDWRDNVSARGFGFISGFDRLVVDWPFLAQSSRARGVFAMAPRLWYSGPQGLVVGYRARTNYLGLTDITERVGAMALRSPLSAHRRSFTQYQYRLQADDVYVASMKRPLMGVGAGFAFVDGIARGTVERRLDLSPFVYSNGPLISASLSASGTYPTESVLLPEQWDNAHVTEIAGKIRYQGPFSSDASLTVFSFDAGVGYSAARDPSVRSRGYGRVLGTMETVTQLGQGQRELTVRINAGFAPNAPRQRSIFASSRDPFETFNNDYFRPRGALFRQPDLTVIPLGGGRLRGFTHLLALERVVSGNLEAAQRLKTWAGAFGSLSLWVSPFADVGTGTAASTSPAGLNGNLLFDAGVGLGLRGKFYDRDINVRLDATLFVNQAVTPANLGGLPSGVRWAVRW